MEQITCVNAYNGNFYRRRSRPANCHYFMKHIACANGIGNGRELEKQYNNSAARGLVTVTGLGRY